MAFLRSAILLISEISAMPLDPMPLDAANKILGTSILGFFVVVLMWAVKELYRENRELNRLRVVDAQTSQTKLLDNNTQMVTAMNAATASLVAAKESSEELRETLHELSKEIRDSKRA